MNSLDGQSLLLKEYTCPRDALKWEVVLLFHGVQGSTHDSTQDQDQVRGATGAPS